MTTPPQLNYAPRPPVHHRRSFRRWIACAVLIATLLSSLSWGPLAWRRILLLYWQHRCIIYESPPNQVVFDSRLGISVVPAEWSEFYCLFSPPGLHSSGTAFLHELQNRRGDRWLVAVDLVKSAPDSGISAYIRLISVGSVVTRPGISSMGTDLRLSMDDTAKLKVFAGHIDPRDPSHFTIDVTEGNVPFTYDGWLTNWSELDFGKRH